MNTPSNAMDRRENAHPKAAKHIPKNGKTTQTDDSD